MSFLIAFLARIVQWIHDFVLWVALHILKLCLAGLAAVLNWIPVPAFYSDLGAYVSSIPPLPAYLLTSLNIGTGVTIFVTAYVLRFLIRRIPFIG